MWFIHLAALRRLAKKMLRPSIGDCPGASIMDRENRRIIYLLFMIAGLAGQLVASYLIQRYDILMHPARLVILDARPLAYLANPNRTPDIFTHILGRLGKWKKCCAAAYVLHTWYILGGLRVTFILVHLTCATTLLATSSGVPQCSKRLQERAFQRWTLLFFDVSRLGHQT